MHVGALMIFDGPPPAREDFAEHIESRLDLVPRYRQKLAFPPLETGRPFWVDDPRFNLDYHVRHTALPKPGSDEQLRELAGRIFSQRLDRSKPLWEVWIVQGLEDNRFALISKTHHALVDGVSGVDLRRCSSTSRRCPPSPSRPSRGRRSPEPSDAELVAEGVKGLRAAPFDLAGRALGALQPPGRDRRARARGGRGHRRGGVGRAEPRPETPAQRGDRPAPAACAGCRAGSPTSRRSRTRSAAR